MAWGDTDEGGFGEFGGVDAADWGGGDKQSDWSSIIDAMRGLFGVRQSNMGAIQRGFVGGGNVPQGPYSSPFQSGWGNVDAMTGAYGPGSPMDPMSGGMGNRTGAGWSQGLGQPAFNPNYSGQGSNPMGYGAAAKPGFFGTPSFNFDEEMEYGGGR